MKKLLLLSLAFLFVLSSCSSDDESSNGNETVNITFDGDGNGLINVYTIEQLNAIRYDLNGDGIYDQPADALNYDEAFPNAEPGSYVGYELMNNLDFNNSSSYASNSVSNSFTTGNGWMPLGVTNSPFTAVFEGNNFNINNLYVNRPTSSYIGLFGLVIGGVSNNIIQNVNLTNASLIGGESVGILAGELTSFVILNCSTSGNITGESFVGGLVGYNDTSLIEKSFSTANVFSVLDNSSAIGGLVGSNDGSISESYSIGSVTVNGDNVVYIGGLSGDNNNSTATISNSYSSSNIIILGADADSVGGLVGDNFSSATISYGYSTGSISAISGGSIITKGGIIGTNTGNVNFSYWDTTTSGLISSDGGTGYTTSQLKNPTSNTGIYSEWSSVIWDFGTNTDYPKLK